MDGCDTARLMGHTYFGVPEMEVTSGGLTQTHMVKVTCPVFCMSVLHGRLGALEPFLVVFVAKHWTGIIPLPETHRVHWLGLAAAGAGSWLWIFIRG